MKFPIYTFALSFALFLLFSLCMYIFILDYKITVALLAKWIFISFVFAFPFSWLFMRNSKKR